MQLLKSLLLSSTYKPTILLPNIEFSSYFKILCSKISVCSFSRLRGGFFVQPPSLHALKKYELDDLGGQMPIEVTLSQKTSFRRIKITLRVCSVLLKVVTLLLFGQFNEKKSS